MKIALLGGSSPFTAALIDALVPFLSGDCELMLFGRNQRDLKLLEGYGNLHLEAIVKKTTDLAEALEGCAVVVQQIRFGGLALREECEHFCADQGVLADETLGPGALLTAMRIQSDLQPICAAIQRYCPAAWILNLTNPLSVVTKLMADALPQATVVGLCELPDFTLQRVAQILEIDPIEISAEYIGLNHRGFLFNLKHQGRDLLPLLLNREDLVVEGVDRATLAEFEAVPLKYFRYFIERQVLKPGRAKQLIDLREQVASELEMNPKRSPPALRQRYLEWYPMSVAPMIETLVTNRRSRRMLNLAGEDGLVREMWATVDRSGYDLLSLPREIPDKVSQWMNRFCDHERAVLAALNSPSLQTLTAALQADPCMPTASVDAVAEALWDKVGYREEQECLKS
jgi:6-phospho-beta-glucosidase